MASQRHPHEELLHKVQREYAEILGGSSQGIYIYLDDPHWICNNRMATLLGYASAREVAELSANRPILDALVVSESQSTVVAAYTQAVNNKVASVVPVTWKKKDGRTLKSQTIFAPISFQGTMMVIHFIVPA